MQNKPHSSSGFSLIEVIIATGILATGMLSLAALLGYGARSMSGSSFGIVAREKAREAVESVHTARDTGRLSWPLIQNTAAGGVFLAGARNLTTPGADGLVNTADDGAVETLRTPGADGVLGNADDLQTSLSNFTREIAITPLNLNGSTTAVNPNLRQIVVTVRYQVMGVWRSYTITTFVSSYS